MWQLPICQSLILTILMEDWITIRSFAFVTDLILIQGKLESEEIEYRLLDEFTVQVDPLVSPAVGGVKLQVKEADIERAREILVDFGYLPSKPPAPSKLHLFTERITKNIPYLNRVEVDHRLFIIVAAIVILIFIVLGFQSINSIEDKIISNDWCITSIIHKNQELSPNTLSEGIILIIDGCSEKLVFKDHNWLSLPGYDSESVYAKWKIESKTLTIIDSDDFTSIYDGSYRIKLKGSQLILTSDNTILTCHSMKGAYGF